LPLPESGAWNLIGDEANADKERAKRFLEQVRERAEAKQARLDALAGAGPKPYDRDKDA
jgi:hypothetical protein